eukprot:7382651-Prymnesium_polylepis.1
MQFIMPNWHHNAVVCFGFVRSPDNKDVDVAAAAKKAFKEITGYEFDEIFSSGISDRAAKGVTGELNLEEEVCGMHDGDKLGRSGTGALNRTKDKVAVNPFPAADRGPVGSRTGDADKVPHIRLQVPINETRVAAQHGMLLSEIRLYHALHHWHSAKSMVAKPLEWKSTPEIWQGYTEVEAVLDLTKITTHLSQYEKLYTGAFGGLIKSTTMAGLRSNTLNVIDLKAVTKSPKLPRVSMDVTKLSAIGATCRVRATLEGERRFCGNKGEELTGAN